LFASVLKREDDKYFLVTPVEKWASRDDAPFLAVEMKIEQGDKGRVLNFRTNVDDCRLRAGAQAALEPETDTGGSSLSARAARSVGQGDAGSVLRSGRTRRGARA
jgi:hypothetical protein